MTFVTLVLLQLLITTITAEKCIGCGFNWINSTLPCCEECHYAKPSGICVPSCDHQPCVIDADCGTYPSSQCAACVAGYCRGIADFGHCEQQNEWHAGEPRAPVLPSAWSADFVFYDYMNGRKEIGKIYYDDRFGGLRSDFFERCPFVQLQLASNDVPCTVLFYMGMNYYIYYGDGGEKVTSCCGYKFPYWKPDTYRVANASFGGDVTIDGQEVSYWRFQYTCSWIRPPVPETMDRLPAYTVQRDIYLVDDNIPFRMNETLTTGYTDFTNVRIEEQDEAIFSELISSSCMSHNDAEFLQYCRNYNAQGRSVFLGFG